MAFQHGIKAELALTTPALTLTGIIEDGSMNITRELAEIKVWGADSVERVPGLYSVDFTINGAWDTVIDAALFSAALSATPLVLQFKPDGVIIYNMSCYISVYNQSHSSTNKSSYSITLQSTGDLTRP